MNSERRDFFNVFARRTAAVAGAAAIPAAAYAADFSAMLKKQSSQFQHQLDKATGVLEGQVDDLRARLDGAAMTQAYQQMQLHLIFLLLLISFAIDGGLSLAWLFAG